MSDNLRIKQPLDSSRVNVNEPYEVNYWCKKWGVTPEQLRAAVKAVGTSALAIGRYFTK